MKIYPAPCKFTESDSFYKFSGNTIVSYNEAFPHKRTLPLLAELWNNFTGGMSSIEFNKDETLSPHTISVGGVKTTHEESYEYSVSVTENGFGAAARSYIGLIHAMMSILQLIQPERTNNDNFDKFHMSCCEISDRPALEMRSIHLSFHCKKGSLAKLKQHIRLCALAKYSHVLIECGLTVKMQSFEEFSNPGAYTKDEVRPVFEEANALGMELIPMYSCFGHGNSLLERKPEYGAFFEPGAWAHCLSNPKLREILKNICIEMTELCGEGRYLHLGGDEAHDFGTCDICRNTPAEKLYADFINEMAAEMKPRGRRVMIWGDTMLENDRFRPHTDKFGHHYIASEGTHPDGYKTLELLDKSVIICDWQYHTWEDTVITNHYFTEKGFDVIPTSACELDNVTNTDAMCQSAKKNKLHGYMQTIWSVYDPVVILRGGVSSWMDDISGIARFEADDKCFAREYRLMEHRCGDFLRKLAPDVEYEYTPSDKAKPLAGYSQIP